jgi:hypothetical protein
MLALIGLFSSVGQVSPRFLRVLHRLQFRILPAYSSTCEIQVLDVVAMLICDLCLGYWSGHLSGDLHQHFPGRFKRRATWQCDLKCRALRKLDHPAPIPYRLTWENRSHICIWPCTVVSDYCCHCCLSPMFPVHRGLERLQGEGKLIPILLG